MVEKYIIDKADIRDLLMGKELPLTQGRARAFSVEVAGRLTNGELIKALFPDAQIYESQEYHYISFAPSCSLECCNEDWWKTICN